MEPDSLPLYIEHFPEACDYTNLLKSIGRAA